MKTPVNSTPKDIYQIVTDKIIARLEEGNIPWHKPWNVQGIARNYATGSIYRGINALLLSSNVHEHQYYLTYKQAADLGGRIRKGSKAEIVTYWNWIYVDKLTGKKVSSQNSPSRPDTEVNKSAFLKYYNVFNVADVEGIDFTFPVVERKTLPDKLVACEQLIQSMPNPPRLQFGGHKAFYSPSMDFVNMPEVKHFDSSEFYYSVFFHELTHSTAHPKRLARKAEGQKNAFGSELYSKEELVAELGASFLCGFAGIHQQTLENSAGYIQNWLRVLRNDKKFLIEAASKAQQATDYILGTFHQVADSESREAA